VHRSLAVPTVTAVAILPEGAGGIAMDGLKPQNEIEAMLALQMAVRHGLAMKFGARLYSGRNIETIPQQDSAAQTLSRLLVHSQSKWTRCRT
jgi:hypothetical protein